MHKTSIERKQGMSKAIVMSLGRKYRQVRLVSCIILRTSLAGTSNQLAYSPSSTDFVESINHVILRITSSIPSVLVPLLENYFMSRMLTRIGWFVSASSYSSCISFNDFITFGL